MKINCIWPHSKQHFGPPTEKREKHDVSLSAPAADEPVHGRSTCDDSWPQSHMLAKHEEQVANVPSFLLVSDLKFLKSPFFGFMKDVFAPQLVMPTDDIGFVDIFTNQTLNTAFETPHLMQALLACSASEAPTTGTFLARVADVHYFKALSGLRSSLAEDEISQTSEITALRTILLLCMYEVSFLLWHRVHLAHRKKCRMYCAKEVHLHLAGAAALIRTRCRQLETQATGMSDDEYLISLTLLEAFIFHATTCIPFHASRSSSNIDHTFHMALQTLLRHMPEDVGSFSHFRILGAPPSLFADIRQVALLHLRSRRRRGSEAQVQQCRELEQKLARWDGILGKPAFGTKIGPRLYVLAARVLLKHMVRDPLHDLIAEAMDVVPNIELTMPFFADYFSWPLYYLGKCLSRQCHRDMLMAKIIAFPGKGPIQRVAAMLEDEWKHSKE